MAEVTYEVTGVSISPVELVVSVPYRAAGTGLGLKVSERTLSVVPSLVASHAGCRLAVCTAAAVSMFSAGLQAFTGAAAHRGLWVGSQR